jgi:2-polyprenyl-6-methoxyphenol hydroxylase-like FAD-dependent oxidoreductase
MTELEVVLMVGGGIAGLTLGRSLHMRGFKAETIECSTEWRAEGGGIMVHANGIRMLRTLGLDGAVEQAGVRSAGGGSATTLAKYCARAIWRRSGATSAPASA